MPTNGSPPPDPRPGEISCGGIATAIPTDSANDPREGISLAILAENVFASPFPRELWGHLSAHLPVGWRPVGRASPSMWPSSGPNYALVPSRESCHRWLRLRPVNRWEGYRRIIQNPSITVLSSHRSNGRTDPIVPGRRRECSISTGETGGVPSPGIPTPSPDARFSRILSYPPVLLPPCDLFFLIPWGKRRQARLGPAIICCRFNTSRVAPSLLSIPPSHTPFFSSRESPPRPVSSPVGVWFSDIQTRRDGKDAISGSSGKGLHVGIRHVVNII
jgi:hypothetical protein